MSSIESINSSHVKYHGNTPEGIGYDASARQRLNSVEIPVDRVVNALANENRSATYVVIPVGMPIVD
jgi:hypothetical protein